MSFQRSARAAKVRFIACFTVFFDYFFQLCQSCSFSHWNIDLDFTEARDSEWQWHQLGHMQVCTSLQTDIHASTPPLSYSIPVISLFQLISKHKTHTKQLFLIKKQTLFSHNSRITCTHVNINKTTASGGLVMNQSHIFYGDAYWSW